MPKISFSRRWLRTILVFSLVFFTYALVQGLVTAQTPTDGFGVGKGQGLETGINLDTLNRVRVDINAGVYDRACTPAEHDPTKWHSLVNLAAKCHYDHEHNDDPNYVNDIFGQPGAWFGAPGQSISYPWQTFKATTALEPNTAFVAAHQMENDLKHEGYVWVVRRDQPCPNGNCVTDFRLQVHAIMGAADYTVRYHSFSLEARLCSNANDPSSCGIVRYGGWIDMGPLFTTPPDVINDCHAPTTISIPLSADTLYHPIDGPGVSRDQMRCQPNIVHPPTTIGNQPLAQWWGHGGGETRFQLLSYNPIANVDASDPTKWRFMCTPGDVNCKFDGSMFSVFIGYTLQIPDSIGGISIDKNGDGRTDFHGYVDRWGTFNPTCSTAGLDCIPYQYDNVILNFFGNKQARYAQNGICESCARTNYNISPPGKDWLTWFFTKYGGVTPPPEQPPPTPVPTAPSVIVSVTPTTANPGDKVEVDISVANLTGLYGLQTQCVVDPNVLTGTGHADGTIFTSSNSFFVDTGFNAGSWTVAASLLQPNPAFTGAGVAYKLNYTVNAAGSSPVTCTALAVDVNGKELPTTVINGSFNGAVVVPPVNPPPTEPPANPPPVETPVPSPTQLSTISGAAAYQNHPDNGGITVVLKADANVLATVTTNADGKYNFTDVPVGTYTVEASAPESISVTKVVNATADGQTINVEKLTLPAGDTDNSGTIDLLDAGLIGANFSGVVPPSPSTADLNVDGKIDIRDLALIGGNFGLTGPVTAP